MILTICMLPIFWPCQKTILFNLKNNFGNEYQLVQNKFIYAKNS